MTTPGSRGIVARGVRRSFGARRRRCATSRLEAQPGRVTGLVGPNGSGKTTLLLMLSSLLAPDAGEIRVGGIDPVDDPQSARAILGWMPDALGAWGSLTALRDAHRHRPAVRDAADRSRPRGRSRCSRQVGLTDLADRPPRGCSRAGRSSGSGLARALVHDPHVLLLDEPASGLDPQARIDLRVLLRRFAAEGRTILVSSHVLSELEEVIDDAVFLVAGETVDAGRVAAAAQSSRSWRIRVADALARRGCGVRRSRRSRATPATSLIDRQDVIVAFATEACRAELRPSRRWSRWPRCAVAEFAPATGEASSSTFLDLGGRRRRSAVMSPQRIGTLDPPRADPARPQRRLVRPARRVLRRCCSS